MVEIGVVCCVSGVTKALKRMNNKLNLPQLQKIMMEFERESEIMDIKEETIADTMDDVLGEGDEEEVGVAVGGVTDREKGQGGSGWGCWWGQRGARRRWVGLSRGEAYRRVYVGRKGVESDRGGCGHSRWEGWGREDYGVV